MFNANAQRSGALAEWRAMDCPINSYGATAKVKGLKTTYCTPCSRGFITKASKSSSAVNYINPGGFGVLNKNAYQCLTGNWAAEGSMSACEPCADKRSTTSDNPSQQQIAATDCFVTSGSGIYNPDGKTDSAKWYDDLPLSTMSDTEKVQLKVGVCPQGRYSESQNRFSVDVAARCVKCPSGSDNLKTGSDSKEDCTVCTRGNGRTSGDYGECTPCARGTFNDGSETNLLTGEQRADWQCIPCPTQTFQFSDTPREQIISASTTMMVGSSFESQCVPVNVQVSNSVGRSIMFGIDPLGYVAENAAGVIKATDVGSLDACIKKCALDTDCHFVEYRYDDSKNNYTPGCFLFKPISALDPATRAIYYKLQPSMDAVAAQSVGPNARKVWALKCMHSTATLPVCSCLLHPVTLPQLLPQPQQPTYATTMQGAGVLVRLLLLEMQSLL